MSARITALFLVGSVAAVVLSASCGEAEQGESPPTSRLPNIVLIYADDLGYGDVSSYGATEIETPAIDRLAAEGLRFTDAHAPAATCTPSRFALLTGRYAWRQEGTGIARGDAPLIIDPDRTTLADLLQRAGYTTGVIGKWHLGLGPAEGADWNGEIAPGPLELGFDEAFLIPATGDACRRSTWRTAGWSVSIRPTRFALVSALRWATIRREKSTPSS